MKKITALILCILLAVSAFAFTACNESKDEPKDTAPAATSVETVTDVTTVAETAPADTEAETTSNQNVGEETTFDSETVADGDETAAFTPAEGDIVIASKEDFIKFNQSFTENYGNADWDGYTDVTVIFTEDINMAGYNWIPIDGSYLDNVTFDGQGHKISNFTSDDSEDPKEVDDNGNFGGYGLIGNVYYDVTFKNLKFDTPVIKAYQKHAGVLIGGIYSNAYVIIDNVDMEDVRVEGWLMDGANDLDAGITIRDSAYVGVLFQGCSIEFSNCDLAGAYICGFHNQACFLGYDASASVDGTTFENCTAYDVVLEFSYRQFEIYQGEKPFKFVSVFFNSTKWLDNIDEVKDNGNLYGSITAKDYMSGTEYNIDEFRSWTEDSAGFQQYESTGSFKNIN